MKSVFIEKRKKIKVELSILDDKNKKICGYINEHTKKQKQLEMKVSKNNVEIKKTKKEIKKTKQRKKNIERIIKKNNTSISVDALNILEKKMSDLNIDFLDLKKKERYQFIKKEVLFLCINQEKEIINSYSLIISKLDEIKKTKHQKFFETFNESLKNTQNIPKIRKIKL